MGRELDGKLVLILEDDPETLAGMVVLIEDAGATAATASTMAEALYILREAASRNALPDAIVCDLLLDDGTAVGMPKLLRTLDPDWGGPIVAVSGHPNGEGLARQEGFHDFLPKLMTPLLPLALAHLFRLRPPTH